jgi:hypothetical protein
VTGFDGEGFGTCWNSHVKYGYMTDDSLKKKLNEKEVNK